MRILELVWSFSVKVADLLWENATLAAGLRSVFDNIRSLNTTLDLCELAAVDTGWLLI